MPAGIPCTTARGLPWPEASKIGYPFLPSNLHKNGTERRATQDVSASQGCIHVSLPTREFFRIEPRQGTLPAGRMRCQINVYDSRIANYIKKTLP